MNRIHGTQSLQHAARSPVALQLYTLRDALAADFLGTLRRVRAMGYRAVETYPFPSGITPAQAGQAFRSLGIEVIAMHCDLPLGQALATAREYAAALNCRHVIWHGWPRAVEHDSIQGVVRLADRYNEAAAAARDNDLKFGLHNHWWELEPIDGRLPCHIFDELLDPDVFFEIDTYWVRTAGSDPALLIHEVGRRVRFLHLKDGPAVHGHPMTALGDGVVDFHPILEALPHPVGLIVELDECATDIFDAMERSHHYLQELTRTAEAGTR